MAPLIVMLAAWLVARSVGTTGLWLQADSWTGALRIALAAMFVFTAVSHFHPRTRPDLIRMCREPARAGATGVGNRCARAARSHRSHGAASAAHGGRRPDGATCRNVSCERPRRTGGAEDRGSPRGAACLAASAAAVLDSSPVVGAAPTPSL